MKDSVEDSSDYHGLPDGFVAMEDGIHLASDGDTSAQVGEWLCSPLKVLGTAVRLDGTGWGKIVELVAPNGSRSVVYLSNSLLFRQNLSELKDRGLQLTSGVANAAKLLDRLLEEWIVNCEYLLIERRGWTDKTCTRFVFSKDVIIPPSPVFFLGDNSLASRSSQAGSMDTWRETIAKLCIDNPVLLFAVSAAFAAPFVELLKTDSFTVHLFGQSSSGKTTALRVANSVWNSPEGIQNWRTTCNALEDVAASANSTLLALDELGQVTAKDIDSASYMIGNGVGKRRLAKNGQAMPTAKWKLIALSTGEVTLAEKLGEAGKSTLAGQEVRFLDIKADGRATGIFDALHGAKDGAALSAQLNAATRDNFGTAGQRLVSCLTNLNEQHRAAIAASLDQITHILVANAKEKLDGPEMRVARAFALIAMAGEIATRFKITGWPQQASFQAAQLLFNEWLDGRRAPIHKLCEDIVCFLVSGSSKLEVLGGAPVPDRVGYRDPGHAYLSRNVMKRLFQSDDIQSHLRLLVQHGVLINEGDHNAVKMPKQVPNRERHHKLSIERLAEYAPAIWDPAAFTG